MNNKSKLINSKELQSEILKLRPFAKDILMVFLMASMI